jgi:allophanate hydrolase
VPSIPTFCTLADLAADPIGPNTRLGTYTNFVNLLGLCGIATPTPARADGRPGSVTLLARAGREALLASVARRIERWGDRSLGATGWPVPEAEESLRRRPGRDRDRRLRRPHVGPAAQSRACLARRPLPARRAHRAALSPLQPRWRPPQRPGLVRTGASGAAIHVEVWALPRDRFGDFMAGIPAPLSIGTVTLADGTAPKGFLCEPAGLADAVDVSEIGDWRRVVAEAGT